jgi:hypothetical protein
VDALASSFGIEVVETSGATDGANGFIAAQPQFNGVLVKTNTAQSITAATDNQIEFDTVLYDTKFRPADDGVAQRMWLGVDFTFVDGDVSVGNDTITETAHGFTTGEGPIRLTNSGGALPTGLATGTDYWVIVDDADTIRLATSRANALAGTDIDITAAAGGGTHTAETETWIVIPAGVGKVKFGSTGDAILTLHKNGAIVDGGFQTDDSGTTDPDQLTATSAVLEVAEGDRFELVVNPAAGTVTLANGVLDSYLAMEVIESTKTLSFPGVTVTPPWRGARATLSGNFSASTTGAFTDITWAGTDDFDSDAFHDPGSNNARMTIPDLKGITKVRLKAQIQWNAIDAAGNDEIGIRIALFNSSDVFQRVVGQSTPEGTEGGFTNPTTLVDTQMVEVVDGDYFKCQYIVNQAETIVDSSLTWYELEVLETDESAFPPEPVELYIDISDWDTGIPTSSPIFKKQADAGPNGGAVVFDVLRNGSSIGSISFADSTGAAQTATFSTTGSVQEDFEIGDRLEIETPANLQNMDEIVIALWAFRT